MSSPTNGTASTSPFIFSSSSSSPAPSPSRPISSPSPSAPASSAVPAKSSTVPSPSVAASSEPSATPTPTPTPTPSSSSVAEPSSSAASPSELPSSTPVSLPPSSNSPPPASSPAPASSSAAPPASSQTPIIVTTTASARPPSTTVITSFVTPSPTAPGETPTPSLVVITLVSSAPNIQPTNGSPSQTTLSSTGTAGATLQQPQGEKKAGGLSTGGKTAIAVVVPVVTIALIAIAGLLLWKRRKQKKSAEEARRKEVEEYGFNPNNDPTLPAVGMQAEMAEDQSGYRGWGNTTTSSNRKASTTLTSGMTYSDSNSNPGGYQSPGSPTQGTYSDGQSADPLMNRRETMESDGIAALGAGPNANQNQSGVHRGPSNASSSYSAADRSDNSGDYPIPVNNPQDYYDNNAYYQPGPYDANGYGNQQPVIRDVSARRNTRIENPSVFPQQGNSGISQNF